MRPGLRLQIVLAIGALLILAFVPLYFAVARLSLTTLLNVRESSARALGRAVAGHIQAARASYDPEKLKPLLHAQLGQEGVLAVGIYDPQGILRLQAGSPSPPSTIDPQYEHIQRIQDNTAILVTVPSELGPVATLVAIDAKTAQATPLVRLVALYTLMVGLTLLVFLYIVLTRLLVRPISDLSRAAERVTEGAQVLDVPKQGARELTDLGINIARMTETLLAKEQALRKQVEETQRLMNDLKAAQAHLLRSEKLASVGRLSAGLAHELGNPIAALMGLAEIVEAGGLSEAEEKEFLRRIQTEAERMHQIIRRLLDFARPSIRPSGVELREAERGGDIGEAVDNTLSLIRPQKAAKDVEIVVDVPVDLPRVLFTQEHLVQVLMNLLLNALDEVPKPGGKIWIEAEALEEGRRVRVKVKDNGAGIAAGVRESLFEPFVTTKEVGRGTGLGLSVCRGLVEASGGRIYVEDGGEGGAVFCVEFLVRIDDGERSRER